MLPPSCFHRLVLAPLAVVIAFIAISPVLGPPGADVRGAPGRATHGACRARFVTQIVGQSLQRCVKCQRSVCAAPFVSPLLGAQRTAWAWGGNHGWRESAGVRTVVTADGAGNLTYANVLDHCQQWRQWRPGYMVPDIIEFREALPRTSAGKVDLAGLA